MAPYRMTPRTARDVCRVLFRHKKKALAVFGVTMFLVTLGILFAPRSYRSEAKLFVRIGRESITLDPTATTGQNVSIYESRENEINSVLDVMQSRAMIEKTVDALGVETILAEKTSARSPVETLTAGVDLPQPLERLRDLDAVGRREKAVRQLEETIAIYGGRKSSVIDVAVEASAPAVAQQIARTFLDICLAEHVRVNRTAGSYEFFEQQAKLLKAKLDTASDQLSQAKNEIGLVTVDGERKLLEDEMGRIRSELSKAETQLAVSLAKTDALKKALASTPAEVLMQQTVGLPNVAGDAMREELYKLEIQEQELSAKYVDDHPLVLAVREQLQNARKIVAAQEPSRSQETSSPNPVYQTLQSNLLAEKSAAEAFRAETVALRETHDKMLAKLKVLNREEVKIAALQRQVDLFDGSYREYAQKLEEGRVAAALEAEQISNVNVVQPPTFVAKPVSPNKRLILVLGLGVAVCGSLGIALVSEYLDHSFKTPDEVEATLDIPVLLSLPRVARRQAVMN